jgi:hypothetical protein
MWNVKTNLIPVIVGQLEPSQNHLQMYLKNVLKKHEVKELQKKAMLGIEHTLRKVLM